ncbi:hypothetical protein BDF14DRAFT_1831688 [Spinellus fusiger]|nr:hypothetical protein BDF14DRAFT_1831688 [Spinellus fusiger]
MLECDLYMYLYIYIYMCVCLCVIEWKKKEVDDQWSFTIGQGRTYSRERKLNSTAIIEYTSIFTPLHLFLYSTLAFYQKTKDRRQKKIAYFILHFMRPLKRPFFNCTA